MNHHVMLLHLIVMDYFVLLVLIVLDQYLVLMHLLNFLPRFLLHLILLLMLMLILFFSLLINPPKRYTFNCLICVFVFCKITFLKFASSHCNIYKMLVGYSVVKKTPRIFTP